MNSIYSSYFNFDSNAAIKLHFTVEFYLIVTFEVVAVYFPLVQASFLIRTSYRAACGAEMSYFPAFVASPGEGRAGAVTMNSVVTSRAPRAPSWRVSSVSVGRSGLLCVSVGRRDSPPLRFRFTLGIAGIASCGFTPGIAGIALF